MECALVIPSFKLKLIAGEALRKRFFFHPLITHQLQSVVSLFVADEVTFTITVIISFISSSIDSTRESINESIKEKFYFSFVDEVGWLIVELFFESFLNYL